MSGPPCDTLCGCTDTPTQPQPRQVTHLILMRDPTAPPTHVEVEDTYALVVDGTAHIGTTTVYSRKDGTETHVVTVRGIRPEPAPTP